jgi:hypothetical protein
VFGDLDGHLTIPAVFCGAVDNSHASLPDGPDVGISIKRQVWERLLATPRSMKRLPFKLVRADGAAVDVEVVVEFLLPFRRKLLGTPLQPF